MMRLHFVSFLLPNPKIVIVIYIPYCLDDKIEICEETIDKDTIDAEKVVDIIENASETGDLKVEGKDSLFILKVVAIVSVIPASSKP